MGTFLNIDYQTWWLLAVAILLLVYAILDGFDLGAGAVHLFLKDEQHKQNAMKAIAPIWDGNEVFLVIGGGALFAGFPEVYATLFSAMYVPFMLFLLFLIMRAVSIEFRNKEENQTWRKTFDFTYGLSSAVLAILLGVVVGNILLGMPMDDYFEFTGSWLGFLNPYAILIGLCSLAFCMVHGSLFLLLKTEGETAAKINALLKKILPLFTILFAAATIYSLVMLSSFCERKVAIYVLVLLLTFNIGFLVWTIQQQKFKFAFMASSLSLVLMMALVVVKHFPYMLINTLDKAKSITIYNGCGSQKSLETMLIIAAIGVPIVVVYVIFAYRTFWGKVKDDEQGY